MYLLVLGLVLWIAAHLFKRLAPGARARMGEKGRGPISLLLLASVVLMVIGYRAADGAVFWGPHPHAMKLNNILMLASVYFFAAAGMKTSLARDLRHPMLWGVVIWAVAHLIVNGDVPSFVLFGTLGLWALVEMAVINRAEPDWTPPPAKPRKFEIMALAGTFGVFLAAIAVHYALGYAVIG